MADPVDDADELRQWRELLTKVAGGGFPLLPNPQWCQDVALVALVLDSAMAAEDLTQRLAATEKALNATHALWEAELAQRRPSARWPSEGEILVEAVDMGISRPTTVVVRGVLHGVRIMWTGLPEAARDLSLVAVEPPPGYKWIELRSGDSVLAREIVPC